MLSNTKLPLTCWGPIRGQDSGMWTNQRAHRVCTCVLPTPSYEAGYTKKGETKRPWTVFSAAWRCLVKVGLFGRRWIRDVQCEARLVPGPTNEKSGTHGEVFSFPANTLTHGVSTRTLGATSAGMWGRAPSLWPVYDIPSKLIGSLSHKIFNQCWMLNRCWHFYLGWHAMHCLKSLIMWIENQDEIRFDLSLLLVHFKSSWKWKTHSIPSL